MYAKATEQQKLEAAIDLTELIRAVFNERHTHQLETVVAARHRLTLRQRIIPRLYPGSVKVEGVRFAANIPDMEGILFMQHGQPMVAGKVFSFGLHPSYWVFTIQEYVEWVCGNEWYVIGVPPQRLEQAKEAVRQLLSEGHRLRSVKA